MSTDTAFLTISELAAAIRSREVSPTEITRLMLERIERIDPRINSFITVTGDIALQQAKDAEQAITAGKDVGPLHGVPIALKDLYATKGIRTTGHSKVLVDWVPDEDATVTTQLREAGTVLLGKLAMHEFAFGAPGFDTPFPPARNPWNTDHITGGSSSGSGAALAAGLAFGSLGSDTGGSIRSPAAFCGVASIGTCRGLRRYATRSRTSSSFRPASRPSGIIDSSVVFIRWICGRGSTSVSVSVASVTAFSSCDFATPASTRPSFIATTVVRYCLPTTAEGSMTFSRM